jgi:hypothetical protein
VPSVASGRPRNDLNQDCAVNGPDIVLLVDCILGAGSCNGIDPDGDGIAPSADLVGDLTAFITDATARSATPCN